jgi:Spy/CpxP family protein refolding chaperone
MSERNSSRSRRWWLGLALAAGASAALMALAVAITPVASVAGAFARHCGGHGFFGGHGHDGGFDSGRLGFGVDWVLRDVDASDEQKAQVTAILEAALQDLRGLHDGTHQRMGALGQALSRESVDRPALEQLRSEHLSLAEDASARLVVALADAAEVLTAEQRRALMESHQRHHQDH